MGEDTADVAVRLSEGNQLKHRVERHEFAATSDPPADVMWASVVRSDGQGEAAVETLNQ